MQYKTHRWHPRRHSVKSERRLEGAATARGAAPAAGPAAAPWPKDEGRPHTAQLTDPAALDRAAADPPRGAGAEGTRDGTRRDETEGSMALNKDGGIFGRILQCQKIYEYLIGKRRQNVLSSCFI